MRILTLLICFAPALAMAAGGEGHGDSHTTTAQWFTLGFTFVNAILFFTLIRHYARAPLKDYLVGRRKETVEAMAEAARAKEEAERLKREYEEKFARLDETRRSLVEEIETIARADAERARAAAEEAGERLRADAERTAKSDLERARRELQAEAARLATEIASRDIQARMSDDERNRLLGEFLRQVEQKQ